MNEKTVLWVFKNHIRCLKFSILNLFFWVTVCCQRGRKSLSVSVFPGRRSYTENKYQYIYMILNPTCLQFSETKINPQGHNVCIYFVLSMWFFFTNVFPVAKVNAKLELKFEMRHHRDWPRKKASSPICFPMSQGQCNSTPEKHDEFKRKYKVMGSCTSWILPFGN